MQLLGDLLDDCRLALRRVCRGLLVDVGHRRIPEDPAHHGGLLQHRAFIPGQRVQPGLDYASQSGRDARSHQSISLHPPYIFALDDHPVFDEHLDQLLEVIGVALGVAGD